ncbi:hypothetical protein KM043_008031 [Ampulex compressa]|nr:hypothetical protein KM043_008031 [Ampulex compressa]
MQGSIYSNLRVIPGFKKLLADWLADERGGVKKAQGLWRISRKVKHEAVGATSDSLYSILRKAITQMKQSSGVGSSRTHETARTFNSKTAIIQGGNLSRMAVCMFWLLTYVGQALDLAVGKRPVVAVQGGQKQDYRHHTGIRKKVELPGNLLHLRVYPLESAQRDDLSNWLLFSDEPQLSSWGLEDMIGEPQELQTVFFALSPTVLNLLYSEYVISQSQAGLAYGGYDLLPHRTKPRKLRIDCKRSRNTLSALPVLVCDDQGHRQSNPGRDLEGRLAGPKTDHGTEGLERGTPGKRNQPALGRRSVDVARENTGQTQSNPSAAGSSIASQLMLRSTRGSILYDVPQIECPVSDDGMERFACPTADRMGRYYCIDDHVMCDGFIDCPTGEDEDRQACMFYKTTKAHLDVLADAILRWARGR